MTAIELILIAIALSVTAILGSIYWAMDPRHMNIEDHKKLFRRAYKR